MNIERQYDRLNSRDKTHKAQELSRSRPGPQRCSALWLRATVMGALLAAPLAQAQDVLPTNNVGAIFVIALENHNWTQPNPTNNPQQILGNPAAPYLNSLVTPGNSNATQVSYAAAYYNAGIGVHPSEPNYVWAEAGSDFGAHTDADPNPASGNTFYDNSTHLISHVTANGNTLGFWHQNNTPHLTRQLNAMGIPWKNYQEDVELAASAINSASGTNGPVNPYNGTTQYNYAVKHNPMAFFSDTALENVYPLAQLFTDLAGSTVGRYNWITPDQYNDAHSSLNGGFTYQGTHFTGDEASVAEADNFLSIVVPQIMASQAYQSNGVIVLWWDETEDGDSTNETLNEVVISKLAKGNAYASTVPMNHSSDLKTMEEIFHLSQANNPIPANETNSDGSFNNVAVVNDLSDLFVPGVIPSISVSVTPGNFMSDFGSNRVFQVVSITNDGDSPIPAPLWLALDNLSSNATLLNEAGTTAILAPLGSPYVQVRFGFEFGSFGGGFGGGFGDNGFLLPHQSARVILQFQDSNGMAITYNPRVLDVTPAP